MKKRRFRSSAEARSRLLSCASISHAHFFSPRLRFVFQPEHGVTRRSSHSEAFDHIFFPRLQLSRPLSAEVCYQCCDQGRRACGCECAPMALL